MNFRAATKSDLQAMPEEARPLVVEDTRGITAEHEGEIQAVCILDSWSPNSCMIHIWIANPFVLRHGYAEEVFKYVFDTGRELVIGNTPSNNPRALKFIKKIGFREVFRVKDGFDKGVDYVITEMRKEDCRYVNKEAHHGR